MSFNTTTQDRKYVTTETYDNSTKKTTGRHTSTDKTTFSKLSAPSLSFNKNHDTNSAIRSITSMTVLPILALIIAFAHPEAFNTVTIGMFIVGQIIMAVIG